MRNLMNNERLFEILDELIYDLDTYIHAYIKSVDFTCNIEYKRLEELKNLREELFTSDRELKFQVKD